MNSMAYTGLRYEVLDAVERRLPPDEHPDHTPAYHAVFAQLQTLEHAALRALNKR